MELCAPLMQSSQMLRTAEALGLRAKREVWDWQGRPALACLTQTRVVRLLGEVDFVSRGPVYTNKALWQRWLAQRKACARPTLLNATGCEAADLRDAGFWPLMTPASVAMLTLSPRDEMRARLASKWRNRLRRAERGLRCKVRALTRDDWLLNAEAEQARARRYKGLPPEFCLALESANPGAARVFEVRDGSTPIAGAVVLRHGAMATWQIGISTDAGRKANAMNLALWTAMAWLSDKGHSALDLGMISADAPGLAHFKLGTGAKIQRLGGSWIHTGALAPIARRLPLRLAA